MSYKKFTKDVGIIGLTTFINALKGLIVLPIITKLLGAGNYGVWAQLVVTMSLVVPAATLGLPYTLVRFLSPEKNKKEIQEGIWSTIFIIVGICLLVLLFLILFSSSISNFFGTEAILVKILALIILIECLNNVFFNVFRAFQMTTRYATLMTIQLLGEACLVTIAILMGYQLFGAVISLLFIRVIIFSVMLAIILKEIGFKLPDFHRMKEYLNFSLPTVPGNFSFWIIQSSDRYIISFFLGALFVGYYVPAYALGNIIMLYIAPLTFILPAVLSNFYDENQIDQVKNYLKHSIKYFLLVAIPSVIGMTVLSKELLTIISTKEIAENSFFVIPFVGISIVLFGVYSILAQIFALKKKTKIVGIIWISAAALNLGLNFIFIPHFGILGAAITTLIAYTGALVISWLVASKNIKFEIDWFFILKCLIASTFMALIVLKFKSVGLLSVISMILLGTTIYIVLMFIFKGIGQKEINFVKELFKKN